MNNYFGFAISDSMLKHNCDLQVMHVMTDTAKFYIENSKEKGTLKVCLNPSHAATIAAMQKRFGIEVEIPEVAPCCELQVGDNLLVLQVSGLPRLDATRHEYTEEEIWSAQYSFILFSVLGFGDKGIYDIGEERRAKEFLGEFSEDLKILNTNVKEICDKNDGNCSTCHLCTYNDYCEKNICLIEQLPFEMKIPGPKNKTEEQIFDILTKFQIGCRVYPDDQPPYPYDGCYGCEYFDEYCDECIVHTMDGPSEYINPK